MKPRSILSLTNIRHCLSVSFKSSTQTRRSLLPLFAVAAIGVGSTNVLRAATLTWDSDADGTNGATDGSGTWDTSVLNWYNGAATDVVWPNTTVDTAVFGASVGGTTLAGAITVGTVNAGAITFNKGGFTLTGGQINIPNTGFTITTNGGTNSIVSNLVGASNTAVTKTGVGTVILSNITATSGAPVLTITGGTLSSGIFNSVAQINAANILGGAPGSPTTQFILDAGTLKFNQNGGNLLASNRVVQVNAAGGAIVDGGTTGNNGQINAPMSFSGGNSGTNLYLSNLSGATTTFTNTSVISGTGNVVWNGAGTAVFQSTTSSYTGGTTVISGVLSVADFTASGSNSSIGTGALTLNGGTFRYTGGSTNANDALLNRTITVGANGGTLDIANGGFLGYGGSFSGSGTLTVIDSGGNNRQLLYTGTSSGNYTGNIVVGTAADNSGFLQYRSNNANAFGTGSITVSAGGTFAADGGNGTPSALSNNFILNGGKFGTQSPAMTYSGTVLLNSGNSTIGNPTNATGKVTLTNVVSGSGALTIVSNSSVTLSGANSYTGATIVKSGVLATTTLAANASNSGIGAGTAVTLDGGTLRYTGGSTVGNFNRTITVGTSGGTFDNASGGARFIFVGGSFTGTGALTFLDSSGSKDQFLITSDSPGFSGNVIVGSAAANSGMLQYRSNAANPFGTGSIQVNAGGILTADGGSTSPSTLGNNLLLNGGYLGTQNINMSYTGAISLLASSTVGQPYTSTNGTIALTGVISGGSSAALNISTTTSVTISGNSNTYTGATNVNLGKLIVNGTITNSTLTTVNTGAILGGTGSLGSLTVASGGTVSPGNSPGILNAGNTSLLAGSTIAIEIGGDTISSQYDQLNVTGSTSLAGLLSVTMQGGYTPANNTLFFILANDLTDAITGTFSNAPSNGATYNFGGQDFQISYFGNYTGSGSGTFTGGNDVVLMAVPESSTALLGGFGALVLLRRRRNKMPS